MDEDSSTISQPLSTRRNPRHDDEEDGVESHRSQVLQLSKSNIKLYLIDFKSEIT
jgi:hypothetical protein